jgi:hypothetical protein
MSSSPREAPRRARPALTLVAQVALVGLVLGYPLVLAVHDRIVDPLLAYRENDHPVRVTAHDGCLRYRIDLPGRQGNRVLEYCGWRRPRGVAEWAPQTRELLVLNEARTSVVELVAFGMLPPGTGSVRYTLPGGQVVETPARRRDGLDSPAFWIHLRAAGIPVDLAEVDGAAVFARFQIFDRAGRDIPVV